MLRLSPSNIKDFTNALSSKRLVLFGAGRALHSFFRLFSESAFLDNVSYIVDNNTSLHGTNIVVGGKSFCIRSPEALFSDVTSDLILVVTNSLNPEIFTQLEQILALKDTPVYSSRQLLELLYDEQVASVNLPTSFRVYKEQRIPKVIHYCWFGGKAIPAQYKEWMSSWKKFCPNYEIVEWNESNYDYKKHPYMEQAYKAGKWAFVTDYARLDVVEQNGGLYFDTDVELLQNMDDFLYQDGFGGFQPDRRFATGLGLGARKGLPILKKFMDLYNGKSFVDFTTKAERFSKNIELTPDILTNYTNARGGVHQRCS